MVMSILQGGPAPSFINSDVFRYLTKQTLTIKGMPKSKYKETAEMVCCNLLEIKEQLMVLYSIRYNLTNRFHFAVNRHCNH
jgi:hypothetical protein